MGFTFNPRILLYILAAIGILLLVGFVIFIVKFLQKNTKVRAFVLLEILLCIGLAVPSWIFNIGWVRIAMLTTLLPIVHLILFFILNIFVADALPKSVKLRKWHLLCSVSYILFYNLLPDGSDDGTMYLFFHLIRNPVVVTIGMILAVVLGMANIVFAILQVDEIRKIKKQS